jgi:signal transduction histidine kinase
MDTATQVIRAEPHVEIGSLLQRDATTIVDRWCSVAREEQASARRVHHAVLRDRLPAFIDAMGRALKQNGSPTAAPVREAKEHGAQRWDSGWSIGEVVHDYQLLRLVVLEYLEENLDRPLYYRETLAVGVFIDDAVAASIARYVADRDEHLHAVEQERIATLADLSRRKDEFLAILGHELRNPLAPIRNSLAVLRKVLNQPHPAVASSLDVMDRQSEQLCRLVDDLLDLARISRGEFELRTARFDLRGAVEQATQMSEALIASRNHLLEVSVPARPLFVVADSSRVCQIVANLLSNAAKYTPPGGSITLVMQAEGDEAVIRVRDNGIGIAPEMLDKVFELFTRVDRPETRGLDGLGIGLALVQRLAQQQGGSITPASEGLGKGAEFTVRLPSERDASGVDADEKPMLVITRIPKNRD